jgi:hypothetical protein
MSAANRIYDVLVEECAAREASRDYFAQWFDTGASGDEFRFCGSLGFGGKFWASRWDVNCYREDETPARLATMDRANVRLAEIRYAAPAPLCAFGAERPHADCMPGWCVLPPSDPRHENHPAPTHGDAI